jgi:hypothetical protein
MFRMVSQLTRIIDVIQFLREASVTFVQCSATVIGKFVFNLCYLLIDEYL